MIPHSPRKRKVTLGGIGCGLVAFMKEDRMNDTHAGTGVEKPPSSATPFPPDVLRLLDVLARIELRRQARLRAQRVGEAA